MYVYICIEVEVNKNITDFFLKKKCLASCYVAIAMLYASAELCATSKHEVVGYLIYK